MSDFVIIMDSTCDADEQMQKDYDLVILPGHVNFPDGSEKLCEMNWETIDKADFFKQLKANPVAFSTAPPNVYEFKTAMESAISEGKDVLIITISSALSGTYNFALQAKTEVLEKYPNAKISVVDSLRFGPAIGQIGMYASMLRAEGKNLDEVTQWIEDNKNRFHQTGWLDDLSFVAKKGRLNHAAAFFGTLAGIKPIGEFDSNGMTTVIVKAKGAKKAYPLLISYMKEVIEKPEEQIIFIAETNRRAQAEEYKKLIEDEIHPKAVVIKEAYASSCVNVGPGLMAAYYMGKPLSQDLSDERARYERLSQE